MDGLWFDQQAFIDCAKEKGDVIKICKRYIEQQRNTEIGLEDSFQWVCQKVSGFHLIEKMSSIGTDGQQIKSDVSVVYILEHNFDPNTVDKDTFFLVNEKLYQVEMIDFLAQRQGVRIYHKYKLEGTQKSLSVGHHLI